MATSINTFPKELFNQNTNIKESTNILYKKEISTNEMDYFIGSYSDINKPIFKRLRKIYPFLDEELQKIATSSNKHNIKIIIGLQLVLAYDHQEYKLYLQNNIKLIDNETTGACTYNHTILDENSDKTLVFAFQNAEEIIDLFLKNKYYYFKNVFTYKYVPKVEDYKNNDIYAIQKYISIDATKIIKKMDGIRYEILKMLYGFLKDRIIYKSSALILAEYNNKIIFPEVEKAPEMHDYNAIPTPEELYHELSNINIDDNKKRMLLTELTKLNKDHNILTMAYYMGTLLIPIINYETTPYLILYGDSNCGKTKTANLFNFANIQSDRTTTTQIMRTCHGYGCGYFVLDEPKTISNDVLQMLKDISTKKRYTKSYGKTGQKYIFKMGGIISANSIYEIRTKSPEDMQAFIRRNIVLKLNEDDKLTNINNVVRKLEKENLSLKKIFIDFLMSKNPQELIIQYESIDTDEEQYKFIIFGLRLLKELFDSFGINFLTDERINEIINRLKETEREFQQDILKDDNIVEMIEQIIYNNTINTISLDNKNPCDLTDTKVLNEYTDILYRRYGYTIYYMDDKKRIAINKVGQLKLIKTLNKQYGTNYPEQTTQEWLAEKLKEKGIYVEISRKRISNRPDAIIPRCLFIEIPYNYDLQDYSNLIDIIIPMCEIGQGWINTQELKEKATVKSIELYKVSECMNLLKHYNLIEEEKEENCKINIKKLKNMVEIGDESGGKSRDMSLPGKKEQPCGDKVFYVMTTLTSIFGSDPIDYDTIKEQSGMDEEELDKALTKLKWDGYIDEPRPGKYRMI
ncbi:hypothetical protein [Methanothermococcus okinawensis]|uniref:Uncharacterized protein n=1 Tax=Methanothermococcus okinawensis (strain DSM 14208 / JCM 11175 / IH1) TaxID=647113 RepID=F8AP17_METOI|nr:hypothetical protein [Methanothermococcus okinawensis]AEH07585.1 hypothetical protein Metok_1623 [Methanothermococcus okinawensis IH1]